ncbi:eosinophil peroxidase-like [Rhinoraja longicauda]
MIYITVNITFCKESSDIYESQQFVTRHNKYFPAVYIGRRGPKGPQGPDGATGAKGENGQIGQVGWNGRPGAPGMKGAVGAPGASGMPGWPGPRGAMGFPGFRGINGHNGQPGRKGGRGGTGQRGRMGPMGAQGTRGTKGDTGPMGMAGANAIAPISAFSVALGTSNPSIGTPIIWQRTIYNGNGDFQASSGIFLCRVPGVYRFTYIFQIYTMNAYVVFRVNGVTVWSTFQSFNSYYEVASASLIINLNHGDKVWLEIKDDCNGVNDDIRLGSPYIKRAVQRAMETVDRAYKETRECQKERRLKRVLSPHDLMRFIKHPMAETRVAVRSAEYMETALNLIQEKVHRIHRRDLNASDIFTSDDLDTIARITGCQVLRQPPVCADDCWANRYRTFTSVCNNRQRPLQGASNTQFIRWLPARYEDEISLPVGWTSGKLISGFPVPLVREVSNIILKIIGEVPLDRESSHLFMQWGQWIDHDMTLSPQSGSIQTYNGGINCETTCIQRSPCFPIVIPPNDTRITNNEKCIPFFRSAPACGSIGNMNTRQQINAITSYLDVNEVYGSTNCLANKLRNLTNEDGLMAVNQNHSDNGQDYLPFNNFSNNICGSIGASCGPNATSCFIAGDVRANEQLALLSFHTMFLRKHNRIAKELKKLNPHWDGERIYQETRKIMGAFQQIIHYRDYLPNVIGSEALERFLPAYQGYHESVNAGIANVFAAAAFRFGHTTVRQTIFRLAENYDEHPNFTSLPLHKTFFAPMRLIDEGGVDPIVRGLLNKAAKLQTQTKMLHDELRERLFQTISNRGLDLGSLNMQRSRDHGIAGYNAWRKFCGLSQPRNESELSEVLNNTELAGKFIELYGTPDNIDLWIGGISEPFVEGGRVGPVLACLLGQQFQNLRNGDRFWWENEGMFTRRQRKTLARISMSRIICDTTGIDLLPRDAFEFSPNPKGYVGCNAIPQVNLKPWLEKVKGTIHERMAQSPQPNIIATVHFTIKITNTVGVGWLKAESWG